MLSSTILFASMLAAPLGQGNAPVSIAWSGTHDGNTSSQRTTIQMGVQIRQRCRVDIGGIDVIP